MFRLFASPRSGDIGEPVRKVDYEPMPDDVPVPEVVPQPEPVKAPEPEKVPV